MDDRPKHHRWLVTSQGNRNLALDASDTETFGTYVDARSGAEDRARREHIPFYVHEIAVTAIRRFTPSTSVHMTDLTEGR